MEDLLWVAVAGFLASLVDGALGMGFGPTSSSILLSSGLSPAAASVTVNIAKIATGLAAAISHWRFENIDHKLVARLAIPGAAGALVGATVLANVDGDDIRPFLAAILLLVGLRILVRFSTPLPVQPAPKVTEGHSTEEEDEEVEEFHAKGVEVAATAGGVTNGLVGAWGPVVTPFLLHRGLPPRFAIGSVNTAEVAVAVVAAGSLLSTADTEGLRFGTVAAMLLGGVIAAPLAAWVVRYIPARALGLAVAGLLLLTQSRELANYWELGASRWLIYAAVPVIVGFAAMRPRLAAARRAGGRVATA